MRTSANHKRLAVLASLGLGLCLTTTGCQIDVAGQTLPSAYWQKDDVQYFPPGAEFKLAREAAAMEASKRAAALRAPGRNVPPAGALPAPANPAAPPMGAAPMGEAVPPAAAAP